MAATALAEEAPRVVITVHGDQVEYNQELNTVAVHGQVRITARSDRPGAPTIGMTADEVEGDLNSGVLMAHGGIKLLSQQAALTGEKLRINVKSDEFVLEHGATSVDVPSQQYPGTMVRGYLVGDQLCRRGDVVFVIEGRITTCDRERPHYSIGARKITYDFATHALRVERGNISLYGRKLTLPGTVRFTIDGSDSHSLYLPLPNFSSYDGLYFRYPDHWEWEGVPWQVDAYVQVGTALRLPCGVRVTNRDDHGVFTASLTRRDEQVWDLDRTSRVDRVPELRYVRHLQPTGKNGLSRLDAEVFAGYLHEHVNLEPGRSGAYAGVAGHYSPMPRQRRKREGQWVAADLYQTFYDTGDSLTDLRLEAGTGWRLNERIGGALWAVHHESAGERPFRFDGVYAENEGFASLELQLAARHQLELYGHYDFDRGAMRDYGARYSYRTHCLTWRFGYSVARESLDIGLDLNGLTGDTKPVASKALVQPDEVPPLPEPVPADPAAKPASPAPTDATPPAGNPAP